MPILTGEERRYISSRSSHYLSGSGLAGGERSLQPGHKPLPLGGASAFPIASRPAAFSGQKQCSLIEWGLGYKLQVIVPAFLSITMGENASSGSNKVSVNHSKTVGSSGSQARFSSCCCQPSGPFQPPSPNPRPQPPPPTPPSGQRL